LRFIVHNVRVVDVLTACRLQSWQIENSAYAFTHRDIMCPLCAHVCLYVW